MTSVYVLTAIEYGKVRECIVIPDDEKDVEFGIRSALYEIYGAVNVCSASREVGHIPDNIARHMAKKSITRTITKRNEWTPNSEVSRPASGKRVLVKLPNDWVTCATYYYNDLMSHYWRDDNGKVLMSVISWRGLEE
jgi:hypothetical protein